MMPTDTPAMAPTGPGVSLWRKEMLELARDGRGWLLLSVFGALLLLAVWMNHAQQRATHAAHEVAEQAEYQRWLNQGERWAHSAAHYGVWAFKPRAALGVADPGIEPFVGSAVWLEAHYQNALLHRPAQDATPVERFGSLSPAVVLGVIGPLVLVLLGFGAVAREREQGTWALAISQGGDTGRILRAKSLALLSWMGLAALPGLALLVASVFAVAETPDAALRLALWIAAFGGYLAFSTFVVVGVSAVAHSSAAALAILLAAWVGTVVWLPRVVPSAVSAAVPLPTQHAFDHATRQALGDAEGGDTAEALKSRLLEEYGVERVEDLPVNWTGLNLQHSEERGNVVFNRLWGELFDRIEAQRRLQEWGGLLSPWMALKSLSERLAGSDFTHHRAFVAQAETHRRDIQRTLNLDLAQHPERDGVRHLSGRELWSQIPAFQFVSPGVAAVLREAWLALAALMLWLLASVLALRAAARRAQEKST